MWERILNDRQLLRMKVFIFQIIVSNKIKRIVLYNEYNHSNLKLIKILKIIKISVVRSVFEKTKRSSLVELFKVTGD